ncbi:hypothetical protein GUJ93_ZPchr0014g47318 [Zizania palustris]|uniref:Uncharacterized protein n=1 Tax=Zizania palustris TaxID=103762 RepID=A0A8J5SWA7_ZIZPA|nr:hypothetical protein GUJ93_ZPchr0014g47318 [Zizania palustris]
MRTIAITEMATREADRVPPTTKAQSLVESFHVVTFTTNEEVAFFPESHNGALDSVVRSFYNSTNGDATDSTPYRSEGPFCVIYYFSVMAYRGHLDGRSVQAPGLMRDGSFPGSATTLEILENKLSMQTAEAEKLIRENQRLASSHVVLRQDIIDTEKEMQMIRAHLGNVQTETDMHIRDLVERMRLMEADIQTGDSVKQELHHVHMEAKRLIAERQMLTVEIDKVNKDLHKLSGDNKNLPELLVELDGLHKEHHSLRSAFEYEKNTNIKQVEQMRTMEMNLVTMTKEADKLRADVANAEKRAQAAQAAAQAVASQQGATQAGAYQQGTTQAGAYQQGTTQAGAYQHGTTQAGAYQHGTSQAGAYQQGTTQAGAYHQGSTQAGAYTYPTAYDAATAYQMHAAQASAYAGYPGYPVAGYTQAALPSYPGAYAAPQYPVSSGVATDAASMYGATSNAGYPAGIAQSNSGAANAGQAPAPYPGAYDPTRAGQR